MRLNKFSLFLVFFFFTFSSFAQSNNYFYGSFESNGVYYQESESTDYDKKFASNTYLNLKYNLNNKWVFDPKLNLIYQNNYKIIQISWKILLSQHSVLISIPIISILQQERYMSNLVVEYF